MNEYIMNMWTEVGLCNGTIVDFVYVERTAPP